MRKFLCLALAAGCTGLPVDQQQQAIVGGISTDWNYAHLKSVNLSAIGLDGVQAGYINGKATGSGVLIAPTLILTVRHNGYNPCDPTPAPDDSDIAEIGPYAFDPVQRQNILQEIEFPNCNDADIAIWEMFYPTKHILPYYKHESLPDNNATPVAIGDVVQVYGYGDEGGYLKKMSCTVNGFDNSVPGIPNVRFMSECGTSEGESGDSGGPIFDADNNLVGLHAGSPDGIDSFDATLRKSVVDWIQPIIDSRVAELRIGDFDGDGRDDYLRWNAQNHASFVDQANGTFPDGQPDCFPLTWCAQQLVVGDFNGDGRDDLLCYDGPGQDLYINYADTTGCFINGGHVAVPTTFCGVSGKVLAGDFDGDGLHDLACTIESGLFAVRFNNGNPNDPFAGSSFVDSWCLDGQALAGRFVDSNRDTLLCRLPGQGFVHRSVNKRSGFSTATGWASSWCSSGGIKLDVGDFNDDLLDDVICWNPLTDQFSIDYSNGSATPFTDVNASGTQDCNGVGRIGYMDAGHRADLICYQAKTGQAWIDLNSGSGNLFANSVDSRAPDRDSYWP